MHEFKEKLAAVHRSLGIPEEYENEYGLALQIEAQDLVEIENDIFNRTQRLVPEAASAWQAMKARAYEEGVVLSVVSAYRSVDRQTEIIKRKINSGESIYKILKVCAAPGFSEHHTGRALDLTTNGCDSLSESFDTTKAFKWLTENAHSYSFRLSYPKGNKFGIAYEPWHWAYARDIT